MYRTVTPKTDGLPYMGQMVSYARVEATHGAESSCLLRSSLTRAGTLAALVLGIVTLTSCGGRGSNPGTGSLSVNLTDAARHVLIRNFREVP
jgi:hypothetical protein